MKKLKYALESVGAPHDDKTVGKLYYFMDLVLERNEIINLTTITERDEFEKKHLMDSIICYGWPEIDNAKKIIDVGTGAGFPGVPLAILYPHKSFLLLDSLNKRLEFIMEAADKLEVNNIKVLHSRAEDAGRDPKYREKFDLCVSRALSSLSILSEYCFPFIRKNGFLYAYKTKRAIDEIEESSLARNLLGAKEEIDIRESEIPGFHLDHNVWVIKKIRTTPNTYPRKAGIPKKVPL